MFSGFMSFFRAAILILLQLAGGMLLPNRGCFAQDKGGDTDPFLKVAVRNNKDFQRWQPLIPRSWEDHQISLLKNVVMYDADKAFPGYNLFLAGRPQAILMDMKGKIIHRWYFPFNRLPLVSGYYTPAWYKTIMMNNGDLLALIPFGGVLKIDKDSRLIWFQKIACHHDFDIDSDGNIYVLGLQKMDIGNKAALADNSIIILSPDGRIKKTISLYGLFSKYYDRSYITRVRRRPKGPFDMMDVFHANSIQVLDGKGASKVQAFQKGNLLISLRNLGVIICVDPDKEQIVWLMDKAFWHLGQHGARLLDNGNILLFDNLYSTHPTHLSRVVEFDPAAKKLVWDYSDENGWFFSIYMGECFRLPNGNTLIAEDANGHAFEVTPAKKIVWEFYDPSQVGQATVAFNRADSKRHFLRRVTKLISIITQFQRIPAGSAVLEWLKGGEQQP